MLIPLKLVRDQQLQQQIFDQLQDLIVSNRLRPGSRMPSSRMMAEQFAISRMTVLLTYERLIAEGYLETRPAAGTFVARSAVVSTQRATPGSSALSLAHAPAAGMPPSVLERTGPAPRGRPATVAADAEVRVDGADPSLFPAQRWRTLMRSGLDHIGEHAGSDHLGGCPALREALAAWLSTSRGLAVAPDQVMVVNGRQQALHVVARLAAYPCEGRRRFAPTAEHAILHANAGHGGDGAEVTPERQPMRADDGSRLARDHAVGAPRDLTGAGGGRAGAGVPTRIVVEDPCDAIAAAALAGEGAVLARVPVDADGLRTDQLPEGDAALIHVTPEHQRPLGAMLSRPRRSALLDWAARAGALILEEDIDGELRYGTMSVPPLMSLDRSERVVLLGGFGVSMGPRLEMAFLVLPRWLVPFALATRRILDDSRNILEQMALAALLRDGGYARHLHRLTKACASRRDALLAALRRHLSDPPVVWGQQAGLHLTWFPPSSMRAPVELARIARDCGLDAMATPGGEAVLLGFGLQSEHHIESRVTRFAERAHARARTGARASTRSTG